MADLNRIPWRRICAGAGLFWLVVWSGFALLMWRASPSIWPKLVPGFSLAEAHFGTSSEGQIHRDLILWLGLLTVMTSAGLILVYKWERLQEPKIQQRLCSFAAFCGVFLVLAFCECDFNFNRPWYDIKIMMTNPGSVPVFGQRLLFVWPAMLLKHLVPSLSYVHAFVTVQLVVLAFAVYLTGEWSALFIGRPLKFVGQLLLCLMLVPTFDYYNGHDFGVVAFYTLCLLLLYRRQYWLYSAAFCLSILNHQNVLLLIPTSFAVMFGRERRSTTLWVTAFTTAAYFSIQFFLNQVIPIPYTHEIKVWWNIRQIVELKRTLVLGHVYLLPWYGFALLTWSRADAFLKRASILLPMQYGVYFLYGQLNEGRLFNGFLPILIGTLLCYVRHYVRENQDQVGDIENFADLVNSALASAMPRDIESSRTGYSATNRHV